MTQTVRHYYARKERYRIYLIIMTYIQVSKDTSVFWVPVSYQIETAHVKYTGSETEGGILSLNTRRT